jgi:hypothetical protein
MREIYPQWEVCSRPAARFMPETIEAILMELNIGLH